jgi:membrane protein YqaA with SNARE-associated domain
VIFAGYQSAGYGVQDAATWVLIATLGNLAGGVGLVTLLRFAQAREQARPESGGSEET